MNELIARLRSHALSNRLRIKEVFQDMDPLNSGTCSKAQFIRCLSYLGISSLGSFNINKVQTEALCKEYKQPNDPYKVNWKKFEEDIESGRLVILMKIFIDFIIIISSVYFEKFGEKSKHFSSTDSKICNATTRYRCLE